MTQTAIRPGDSVVVAPDGEIEDGSVVFQVQHIINDEHAICWAGSGTSPEVWALSLLRVLITNPHNASLHFGSPTRA